jgi:hypothetical protein
VQIVYRLVLAFNSAISGTLLLADDGYWLTTMKQMVDDYLEMQPRDIVSRPSITISAVLAPLSARLGSFLTPVRPPWFQPLDPFLSASKT